jgi:pyridoxine 5'-phosphate synthase PdxJ
MYSCHNSYYCERKRVEILNGNYGEDDKVEVNQMGKSTNKYASMSEMALLNLINVTAGSKLTSSHTPL